MTLKEAIEKEVISQGISAIDISKASGVSKATIYNILNGLTDDSRIRPSTKRAIARGCNRELRTLSDGGVEFVWPGLKAEPPGIVPNAAVRLRYSAGRPFLTDSFCQEVFDWLHDVEKGGRIPRCDVVNRVFQKRPEFLSLSVENAGNSEIASVVFSLAVSIPKGRLQRTFSFSGIRPTPPLARAEITLFLSEAEFDFDVEISQVVLSDVEGTSCTAAWEHEKANVYRFRKAVISDEQKMTKVVSGER